MSRRSQNLSHIAQESEPGGTRVHDGKCDCGKAGRRWGGGCAQKRNRVRDKE